LGEGEGKDDDRNLDEFDFLVHHQSRPQIFCLRIFKGERRWTIAAVNRKQENFRDIEQKNKQSLS